MGDNSTIVPRSLLDEENEVIFFYHCLAQFGATFPDVVAAWKGKLERSNADLLQKYLSDSQQNMKDFQKRKIIHEKEKAQRQQMAMNAIRAAKELQQQNGSK